MTLKFKPRKRFGQHFLHDRSIIQHILSSLALKNSDKFIEIGPGQGALTAELLKTVSELWAIEIDRDLADFLDHKFKTHQDASQFIVHRGDVLDFNFKEFLSTHADYRMVANLPYNISTPLLIKLLPDALFLQDIHFMLQKEVVLRMIASPGSKDYGRLSLFVQYFTQAVLLFEIPPEAFSPPPKVDSAFVRLVPYKKLPYPALDFDLFQNIIKLAFQQRRKTLKNSLKEVCSASDLEKCLGNALLRPEQISLQEFVALSNFIAQKV